MEKEVRELVRKRIYLFAVDGLFWCFQQFVDNLFRFECDETESFSLVLRFVERHFYFDDLKENLHNYNLAIEINTGLKT